MTALELADDLAGSLYSTHRNAADLLRRQHAEIQQWRNVFGFLGTPDELGNEWNALKEVNSRQHEAIVKLREACQKVVVAFDALPRDNEARYSDLQINAARIALKDTEGL